MTHAALSPATRLLVTRPQPQADDWVAQLRALGWSAQALPLLGVGPAPDPGAVAALAQTLRPGDLVMFVSPNAALHGLAAWPRVAGALVWPAGVRAAATGAGTVAALRQAGVPAEAIVAPAADAPQFDSEALWACLQHEPWAGRAVCIVRGEGGRDWFGQTMQHAGAQVRWVQGYVRGAPEWSAAERECLQHALAHPGEVLWLFSSSEAIDHLARQAPGAPWALMRAVASHPRIAERARAQGMVDVQQLSPGIEPLHRWLSGA